MATVRAVIIRCAGSNCDEETAHALRLAGADAERVHLSALAEQPARLSDYQLVVLPGGFSFGDDIAAGRIFAAQLRRRLLAPMLKLVDTGGLLWGICNGFQVLAQLGLLPWRAATPEARRCAVAPNDPPRFQARWVSLRANRSPCVFLEPGRVYEMPIAHGEGRVQFATPADLAACQEAGLDALHFVPPPPGAHDMHGAPYNPNGSTADIAGLCDSTGRIFGLMPHPERFVAWTQHPAWTSLPPRAEGDGLALFRAAVDYFK